MLLKISKEVNSVILGQTGPKLTNVTFAYVLCPKMLQNFKKIIRD